MIFGRKKLVIYICLNFK